jgi:2'-5' RNA ligase
MPTLHYALVAYVRNAVGEFVEALRQELHPEFVHLPAHVTVLPPRCLQGSEAAALDQISRACSETVPFEVALGDVETFVPTTPTVFIRVAWAGYRLRELHLRLNREVLHSVEQWPYMPHLTIAKMSNIDQAREAFRIARERWASYTGPRRISIEELTFVREGPNNTWVDLAPVPLGSTLVRRR